MTRPYLFVLLSLLALGAAARADPPAPAYTLYGTIRAEDGRPLTEEEGFVVLSTEAGEVAHCFTDSRHGGRGVNYRLKVPMDSFITSNLYKETAALPKTLYQVKVLIGGTAYVPYVVGGQLLDTEHPGDLERFDFILGIDSDGDGLPDAWERSLIDFHRNEDFTRVEDITPDGDINGNGITNYGEFIAGLDHDSAGLFLDMIGMENGVAHLQFLTARGRTYTLRASADLKNWSEVSFSLDPSGAGAGSYYYATDSDFMDVYVPGGSMSPGQSARFFKLYVE